MSRNSSLWDASGNSAEDWRIFEILCEDVKMTSDSKVSSKQIGNLKLETTQKSY